MKNSTASLAILSLAATTASAFTYTGGHADIGVAFEGGALELHFHGHADGADAAVIDGVPIVVDTEFEAGDITIVVPNSVSAVLGAGIPETGVGAGETIWALPQTDPGTNTIPFLGIGAEELVLADWLTPLTFSLGTVTSPSGSGDFSLWQTPGGGGFDFLFSTALPGSTEGAPGNPNEFDILAEGHDHYNFGFSEAGTWLIEMTVSGTHATDGFQTDTQTFEFTVVPEPSTFALLFGAAAFGLTAMRRRR